MRMSSLLARSGPSTKTRHRRESPQGGGSRTLLLLLALAVGLPVGWYMLQTSSGSRSSLTLEVEEVERLSREIKDLDGIKAALSSAVKALQEIERREQAERASHRKMLPTETPVTIGTIGGGECSGGGGVGEPELLRPVSGHARLFSSGRLRNGVFVDVGAGDGIFMSKSWYFEKVLCWEGLVVEPSPVEFTKLQVNRPRSEAHDFAVCAEPGERQFTDVTKDRRWTGWSGFEDTWTPVHRAEVEKAVSAQGFSLQGVTVRCETLAALLSAPRWAGRAVDLLTVAVEGHELQVLQSVDWAATVINVVQVEVPAEAGEQVRATRELLLSKGFDEPYRLWTGHKDLVFVRAGYEG